ncbi:MAG: nucleoside hydrolase [Christensenellaceae bacterium]|jgi:inosine-uridine nucleoside N-ribohydrolase|nr:nucleoside hydrolase [Christensenellaceae bacterium]
MKREEILNRLGFKVPDSKKKRVIVHSDVACEADDHFAIAHHLMTPSEIIVGIIAGHFEYCNRTIPEFAQQRFTSTEKSFAEGRKILDIMEIDDIPLIRGAKQEIADRDNLPESPGADFIIEEALKDDERPLYIALQGCLTDLAIALIKEPQIADKMTAIWIGGGGYPDGKGDFNMMQDVLAAQIVFESNIPLWQIPASVYSGMNITLAELVTKVKPCGAIGEYLVNQMLDFNDAMGKRTGYGTFPYGETWAVGDQPTVSVLLQGSGVWHNEYVTVTDDMIYSKSSSGREIRVYDEIDRRMTMEDFFAKLELCYCGRRTSDFNRDSGR